MARQAPLVSILLPTFNAATYLTQTIDSVLSQTYSNFELLILDDFSTDTSINLASNFKDSRINISQNKKNLGLALNLNLGLKKSRGKYVARLDADDVCLPLRLEKQVAFLEAYEDIDLLGSAIEIFGSEKSVKKFPEDHAAIVARLLFRSSFAHPAVMFNREAFLKNNLFYDPKFVRAQDFDLWTRASRVITMANLPDVLVKHRIHADQISNSSGVDKTLFTKEVLKAQLLTTLNLHPNSEELFLHWQLGSGNFPKARGLARTWLQKIHQANEKTSYYNKASLEKELESIWLSLNQSTQPFGLATIYKLFHQRLL